MTPAVLKETIEETVVNMFYISWPLVLFWPEVGGRPVEVCRSFRVNKGPRRKAGYISHFMWKIFCICDLYCHWRTVRILCPRRIFAFVHEYRKWAVGLRPLKLCALRGTAPVKYTTL